MFSSSTYKSKNALLICNDMKSCQEDIFRLEKILKKYDFNISKSFASYPKREIQKFLKKENFTKDDLLYIHYSGHGVKRGKKINNEYKLISSWVNPNGSVICSDEIDTILSAVVCKVVLTTDSCHSATFGDYFTGDSLIFIGTSKVNDKSKTYIIDGEPAHGSLVYLFENLIKSNLDIDISNIKKSSFFQENNIDTKLIIKIK